MVKGRDARMQDSRIKRVIYGVLWSGVARMGVVRYPKRKAYSIPTFVSSPDSVETSF